VNVFITWSGSLSRDLAVILHEWLPLVMQEVEPFVSEEDVRKGNRWLHEIQKRLANTHYGVAVITRESLSAEWLLYEAGALSKDLKESVLWTVLFEGLTPTDIGGPLRQFLHSTPTKEDFWKLVESMNEKLERPLSERPLQETFDQFWPKLEAQFNEAIELHQAAGQRPPARTDREILDELLELTRQTAKGVSGSGLLPEKHHFIHRQFSTIVVPEPDQDEGAFDLFQELVAKSEEARAAQMSGYGQSGGAERMNELNFQAQYPMSREALKEIAREAGLRIVDIYFRPLPLRGN